MSARVESLTDMTMFEDAFKAFERINHWYPSDPRYRLSGQHPAQIGDIAYCGHVKDIPPTNGLSRRWPQCPQCLRLMRMTEGRAVA